MDYTEEQIQIQAKCFQLLAKRVKQYYMIQHQLPAFIKDKDPDSSIGSMTRWVLEENKEEAFGKQGIEL